MEISKEFHPFISGPNGSVAKRISEETGARINIPPVSLMKNEMSVAGDKDGVAKAVAEIQKIHANIVRLFHLQYMYIVYIYMYMYMHVHPTQGSSFFFRK